MKPETREILETMEKKLAQHTALPAQCPGCGVITWDLLHIAECQRKMQNAPVTHGPEYQNVVAQVPGRGYQQATLPLKLNLGCCDRSIKGYRGIDLCPGPGVDEVADLSKPWPWPDSSVAELLAFDIIEHLPDNILTMNEAFRVLEPGGTFAICVPTTDGRAAFQDPTHVSFWNRNSFWYFEANNPYRERFAKSYGITARFLVKSERNETTIDGPKLWITLEKPKG